MKKKRYLFLYGPLNGGGAERVLLDILRNFDYTQNEIHLCQFCGGGILVDEVPAGVDVDGVYVGLQVGLSRIIEIWLA